jgi:hypothetical protein
MGLDREGREGSYRVARIIPMKLTQVGSEQRVLEARRNVAADKPLQGHAAGPCCPATSSLESNSSH